jgi:hypothetical protein
VLLGLLWVTLWAYLDGRVHSVSDVEELTGGKAELVVRGARDSGLHYLKSIAGSTLVGVECDASKLTKKLNLKLGLAKLPADADKLVGGKAVLVVRLDATRKATLRALKLLKLKESVLVIWG